MEKGSGVLTRAFVFSRYACSRGSHTVFRAVLRSPAKSLTLGGLRLKSPLNTKKLRNRMAGNHQGLSEMGPLPTPGNPPPAATFAAPAGAAPPWWPAAPQASAAAVPKRGAGALWDREGGGCKWENPPIGKPSKGASNLRMGWMGVADFCVWDSLGIKIRWRSMSNHLWRGFHIKIHSQMGRQMASNPISQGYSNNRNLPRIPPFLLLLTV